MQNVIKAYLFVFCHAFSQTRKAILAKTQFQLTHLIIAFHEIVRYLCLTKPCNRGKILKIFDSLNFFDDCRQQQPFKNNAKNVPIFVLWLRILAELTVRSFNPLITVILTEQNKYIDCFRSQGDAMNIQHNENINMIVTL